MRDPTRGGIATTLNEFAKSSGYGFVIEETKIPVKDQVKACSEILGIDPLYIANEGKLVAIVKEGMENEIIHLMQIHDRGKDACIIGEVVDEYNGLVAMKTGLGVKRIIDMPVGEQLPRIC